MKLLIIDDEKLTREGIRDRLPLSALGIHQVLLADDGIHGLEAARAARPDLILTDVRMPRMNGVEMAEAILRELPDTIIIFMSAYSDKEYLKAAIKLNAVSYVEKPLDMKELKTALADGVTRRRQQTMTQTVARLHERELASRLAFLLIQEDDSDRTEAPDLAAQLEIPLGPSVFFLAQVTDLLQPVSRVSARLLQECSDACDDYLRSLGFARVSMYQEDRYLVSFLISSRPPSPGELQCWPEFLQQLLRKHFHFFIAPGSLVTGTEHAWRSFREAMARMSLSFFRERDSILTETPDSALPFHPPADVMTDFAAALSGKNEEQALESVRRLSLSIDRNGSIRSDQVRDLYFHYLSRLDETGSGSHLQLMTGADNEAQSLWSAVVGCATLSQLDGLLRSRIHLYFRRLRESSPENPLVFQIKEYIRQNYSNPSLGVPDVSAYVRLSASYVCTLFKNETGQTLNQFLTDYRIKMSKQFLCDPRYRIADISSKVGYSDGNYYSKTFRKMVGLSPSEYREKMML